MNKILGIIRSRIHSSLHKMELFNIVSNKKIISFVFLLFNVIKIALYKELLLKTITTLLIILNFK